MSSLDVEGSHKHAEFDPWLIINSLRRHLPVFAAIVIVFLLLAFGYTSLQKPMYTSQISILVDSRPKEIVASSTDTNSQPMAAMDLETQVAVLMSPVMAKRVADKLNLKSLPEFDYPDATPEEILVGRIDAQRSGSTYVIVLSVRDHDPKLAARIAQAYGEAYIGKQIQDKSNSNDAALTWLDGRLSALRAQAESDDGALQAYKIAHNLMSMTGNQGATLAEQEISALNQQLAQAKADLSEKRARRDAAISNSARGDVAESLSTDLVRQLRKQRSDVSADLAKLRVNYGPKHPDVIKDQQQIADIDAEIDKENHRTLESLNADVRIAEQRYASLSGSHNDASSSLRSNNVAEVGLMELQRKADASHTVYESFLNRARELAAQIGLQQPQASIIEMASVPSGPSSPNLKLNLALALLGGLLVGGAYVGVAELLDNTYKSGREVAMDVGVKTLASIPLIDMRGIKNKDAVLSYVLDKPYSLFSEAIRSLRTQIALAAKTRQMQVIAVTSALPGEGKTLTCLSLARAMAANGAKVLLIDADFRRFSLTKYLNIDPVYGIQDVFNRPQLMSQSIVVDEVSGAGMILVPRNGRVSTEVFTNDLFEKMINSLINSYDYIILDTAPVLALSDIRVLSAVADGIMLVVRWKKTPRDAVHLAQSILDESEAKMLGICLNQVNMRSPMGRGYGDSIHYFNEFKEYWSDRDA
jgi:succinoglycan biosynthesis transport protein ExoP